MGDHQLRICVQSINEDFPNELLGQLKIEMRFERMMVEIKN